MTDIRQNNSLSIFTASFSDGEDLSRSNRLREGPSGNVSSSHHTDLRIARPPTPQLDNTTSQNDAPVSPSTVRTAAYRNFDGNNTSDSPHRDEADEAEDGAAGGNKFDAPGLESLTGNGDLYEHAYLNVTQVDAEQSSRAFLQAPLPPTSHRKPLGMNAGGSTASVGTRAKVYRHIFSDGDAEEETEMMDMPSPYRHPVGSSSDAAGQTNRAASPVLSGGEDQEAVGSSPTSTLSGDDYGMESVLEKASKITGFRLVWLLYTMLVVVIIMFVMIFVQITYSTNGMLRNLGSAAVESTAASAMNNAEMVYTDLNSLMDYIEVLQPWNKSSFEFDTPAERFAMQASVCYRASGAIMSVGAFNLTGAKQWELDCAPGVANLLPDMVLPGHNDTSPPPTEDTVRLIDLDQDFMMAYRTMAADPPDDDSRSGPRAEEFSAVMVILQKSVVGRLLFSNDIAKYSDGTLQELYTGYFFYKWDDTLEGYSDGKLHVTLTSLTKQSPSYTARQPTPVGGKLQRRFDELCHPGSEYVWHSVMRSGNAGMNIDDDDMEPGGAPPRRSALRDAEDDDDDDGDDDDDSYPEEQRYNGTLWVIPKAYRKHGGAWGLLQRVTLCGVFCVHPTDAKCSEDNPSNVWFIVDYPVSRLGEGSAVTVIGAISIVAVVLFTIIMGVTYVSITVPIHFLRFKLSHIVGSRRRYGRLKRLLIQYTHRLWLGELVALARAIHVLGTSFRLNKKYVPAHVLAIQARSLSESKNRCNYLSLASESDDDSDVDSVDSAHVDLHNGNDVSMFIASATPPGGEDNSTSLLEPIRSPEGRDFLSGSFLMSESTRMDTIVAAPAAMQRRVSDLDAALPPLLSTSDLTAAAASGRGRGTKSVKWGATPSISLCADDSARPGAVAAAAASSSQPPTVVVPATSPHGIIDVRELSGGIRRATSFAVVDGDYSEAQASYSLPAALSRRGVPPLRVSEDCSVLCIFISVAELAYTRSYATAVSQHRKIIRLLLSRIRAHKGFMYYRCGDCLAAAWNAFDNCPTHVQQAAACAVDIGKIFLPLKDAGLQIGISLSRGRGICGTFEDAKEAFATVFGEMPRCGMLVAELAAEQHSFGIVATESVKQALAGLYEFAIIDVIRVPGSTYPMSLFNLGEIRQPVASPASDYAVQWAKLFSHFRFHEFTDAMVCIEAMQRRFPERTQSQVFARLQILCEYYSQHPTDIPCPYQRDFPAWTNYELLSLVGLHRDGVAKAASHAFEKSYNLPDVLPAILHGRKMDDDDNDDVKNFRKDLEDNVNRRLATPGVRHPSQGTINASFDVASARATMEAGSFANDGAVAAAPATARSPVSNGQSVSSAAAAAASATTPLGGPATATGSPTLTAAPAPVVVRPLGASYTVGPAQARRHADPEAGVEWSPLTLGQDDVNHFDSDSSGDSGSDKDSHIGSRLSISASDDTDRVPLPPPLPAAAAAIATAGGESSPPPKPEKPFTTVEDISAGRAWGAEADRLSPSEEEEDAGKVLQRQFSVTRSLLTLPPLSHTHRGTLTSTNLAINTSSLSATGNTNATRHLAGSPGQQPPVAETLAVTDQSIIQSLGLSFREETSANNFGLPEEMPSEIHAKNGTTYLRSSQVLGKGSFGSVSLGMDVHSGKLVAIKFLPIPLDKQGMELVEREVKILQVVKDSHIVEFISYAFINDMIIIIMECMMAGSLQNMISSFTVIPSGTARLFIRDVLRGLSKLHSINVIHRDVKPQNVLMSLSGMCKISDFGASAWINQIARQEADGVVRGTPVYLAPEAARGNPLKQSDLWSCGIMFLQLIRGRLPYPQEKLDLSPAALVFQIGNGDAVPEIPTDLDELDAEFVSICLRTDPAERLSAKNLLQLALFTV